jgi:hypothetical protein
VTTISQIKLYPVNDGKNNGVGFPLDFTIDVSYDGVNWLTVISEINYPHPLTGEVQVFNIDKINARYVRLQGTSLRANPDENNAYRMQIAEIELNR